MQAQTVISAVNTIGKTNWRTSKHSSFTVFSFFFYFRQKRKTIYDLIQPKSQSEKTRLRKCKSLPDTSSISLIAKQKSLSGDDEKDKKKKKKLVKKVKAISNAKTFTTIKKD